MRKIDHLEAWKIFCEVVRSGGVLAACDVLQCEPSKVSRTIAAMEKELQVSLFSRESKPVRLTEVGELAYTRACALIREHEAMIEAVMEDNNRLSGLIRIGSAPGVNTTEITPAVIEWQMMHPEVSIEVGDVSGQIPEAFQREDGKVFDIISGYGPNQNFPNIISHYVGEMPFIACASPLYIKRHGMPESPEDCKNHIGIINAYRTRSVTKVLSKGNRSLPLQWETSLYFHNYLSAKKAAILGAGIIPDCALYHCAQEIRSGLLVPVMPGWQRDSIPCYVFVTEQAWQKKRVQLFFDWFVKREIDTVKKLEIEFSRFYTGHHAQT